MIVDDMYIQVQIFRSGADCGFILNTILWKSAAKRKKVHMAFLDLQKGENYIGMVCCVLKHSSI